MKVCETVVKVSNKIRLNRRKVFTVTVLSTARRQELFELSMAVLQRQLLRANRVIKVMRSIPFLILLTNVFSQNIHVPKQMIIRRLCNGLTTIFDLTQISQTQQRAQHLLQQSVFSSRTMQKHSCSKLPATKHQRNSVTELLYRMTISPTTTTLFACLNHST